MKLLQNDTQMNMVFCKETKQLLKTIKKQIKTNKIDKDILLISTHNLKAISLLFELDFASELIFELENYVFDLRSVTLTNKQRDKISELYKKIKKQFKLQQKELKCILSLYKAINKFNNTLNKNTTNNKDGSDVRLGFHTKMHNKPKRKIQKHIIKILFELIKNSHSHGFANANMNNKKINIKIFYKDKKLIIFYKDNGIADNNDMFMSGKSAKTNKNILYGFGIGSKLINKYAKKLNIKIHKISSNNGFRVILH